MVAASAKAEARHVAVFELCDGKRTMEEIAETLAKEYAAPVGVIRADVLDLLQALRTTDISRHEPDEAERKRTLSVHHRGRRARGRRDRER
jgi:Coenzyme PQQ synthesis protein D (PqqD)